jgi:transposase-like protein
MVLEPVRCPTCQGIAIFRHGRSVKDKSRYKCLNPDCHRSTFILNCYYRGHLPEVKQQIIDMALNGSVIRDIACVLKVSSSTVIEA